VPRVSIIAAMVSGYITQKFKVLEELVNSNSPTSWLVAGVIAVTVWSVLGIVRRVVAARYKKFSAAQHRMPLRLLAYLIANTQQFFLFAVAVQIAQAGLTLPDRVENLISNTVMILLLLQIGIWAGRSVHFYLESKTLARGADQALAGSLDIVNFVSRMLIWSLLFLVALSNLGVNISALLAGLGVGGVAVALALQNILGDLFASLSIALDKPFVAGDRLEIDTYAGKVEHIGIKSTRLRSDTGEQIIVSNADLLKSRVRNYGRALEQRTLASFRVTYDTPTEKLSQIPKLIESIVRAQPNARFERCHLKTVGDSALLFELAYFVQQPSLNSQLDLQQAVNLRIIEEFRRLEVAFDYPTQRVILARSPAPASG
jgi:small-conductance mechanosensitive channel